MVSWDQGLEAGNISENRKTLVEVLAGPDVACEHKHVRRVAAQVFSEHSDRLIAAVVVAPVQIGGNGNPREAILKAPGGFCETGHPVEEYALPHESQARCPEARPMKPSRRSLLSATFLALVLTLPVRAEAPPSPLRLIPADVDLVAEIPQPRELVMTFAGLEAVRGLERFSAVKEVLDSTSARRGRQMLSYFEKQIGKKWPALLDELAGGGVVLGVKFGPDPAPALLAIQGRDPEQTARFARLALEVLEQELARRESKDRPVKGNYRGVETVRVGGGFHAGVVGAALLLANREATLHKAVDLYLGPAGKSCSELPGPAEASRLLPADSLVRVWLNMVTLRQAKEAKALYKSPRDDPNLTILFGGYLDLLGRTPFVAGGLYLEGNDLVWTFRTPRGREGMGPDLLLHTAPSGRPGSRLLLEPGGVVYSSSFFLDLPRIWNDRAKLFPEKIARSFEEADKKEIPFLSGLRLSKLLTRGGAYHRVVVARQAQARYRIEPTRLRLPAFGVVSELTDPEPFQRSVETVFRGVGLAGFNGLKMRLVEQKVGGANLVGYRFREDDEPVKDPENFRFNFSPCMARVANQFVACSTIELGRELVDVLQREGASPRGDAVSSRSCFYLAGGADLLGVAEDQFVTRAVLDRAVPAAQAASEVKSFLTYLRGLGTIDLSSRFGERDFRFDVRYRPGK